MSELISVEVFFDVEPQQLFGGYSGHAVCTPHTAGLCNVCALSISI